MNIVVTREAGKNEQLRGWLPSDATVQEVPLTMTHYVAVHDFERHLRATKNFGAFSTLVVTSARSATYAVLARQALASHARVLSVGFTTTQALEDEGVSVDVEAAASAVDLEPLITKGPVLMIGALQMREELPEALELRNLEVERVACYETLPVVLSAPQEEVLSKADVVFIGAPSAWSAARPYVGRSAWVIVRGPTTGDVVRRDHERVAEGWGPSLRTLVPSLFTPHAD